MDINFIYLLRFFWSSVKGIFRKQQLNLGTSSLLYEKKFQLTAHNYQQWYKQFKVPPTAHDIPFDFFWPHFVNYFFIFLESLQINYRNILHLSHSARFLRGNGDVKPQETVLVQLKITDVAYLGRDRAVVIVEARIATENDEPIAQLEEGIFVKNLSTEDIQLLQSSAQWNHTPVTHLKGLSKHQPSLTAFDTTSFYIPPNFGLKYGQIAGDFNPIHLQSYLAKLFGYPQAFLQGSAVANLLTMIFFGQLEEQLAQITIYFANPVALGQTLEIRYTTEAFEVFDETKKLVAFGTRRLKPSLKEKT